MSFSPAMAQKIYAHADDNECSAHETVKEILAIGFSSAPTEAATMAARTRGFNDVRNLAITRFSQFCRQLADELEGLSVIEPWRAQDVEEIHAP